MRIDFHTHAFADALAQRAIAAIEEPEAKALLDGTAAGLLASMKCAGIQRAVVCPIATKPSQFEGIRTWALETRAAHPELEMLCSIHPGDPDALARIDQAARDGFRGIKLHAYYQHFVVDAPALLPIYQRLAERNMFVLFHAGFDIGFPHDRIADPIRLRRLHERLPDLRIIAAHFGGWRLWEEVLEHLAGLPNVYIETSFSLGIIAEPLLRDILARHPPHQILFGTDSPWRDQAREIAMWQALHLPHNQLEAILGGNAARLLAGE